MSRRLRVVLLFFALALPLSDAFAAVDPNPIQNREPAFNKKTLDLLNEAARLIQAGKMADGIRQLNLAVSLEPSNPYVLARMGVALNMAGDYQNALDHLRRAKKAGGGDEIVLGPMLDAMLSMGQNQIVMDLFPDPPADSRSYTSGIVLRARASALQVMGNSAAASTAMKRSLAILNDYDGMMTAGRIALLQGDFDIAENQVDEALKLRPKDLDARTLKIDLAMQRRQSGKAQEMADLLVSDYSRSLSARLVRIKVLLASERIDKAGADIDRVMQDMANVPMVRYFKAFYLARRGDPKGAWDVAHSLPKEFLQVDPSVAYNVANMAIDAGYLDSAASILNVVVLHFPWQLEARLALADLRLRQKSPEHALNTLKLVQDSKDPRIAVLFARAALMKQDPKTAQRFILQAIDAGGGEELRALDKDMALRSLGNYASTHPQNKLVKKQYAILLLGFGELDKARAAYEKLVRDDPSDAVGLNNLAWLVVKDDPTRALSLAQRAVKADPSSANYLDTLGTMQMNRSDFKNAIASLQKAHDMVPDSPEVAYHLAVALEAGGQREQSQLLLQGLVKRGGFGDLDAAKTMLASKLKMAGQTQADR